MYIHESEKEEKLSFYLSYRCIYGFKEMTFFDRQQRAFIKKVPKRGGIYTYGQYTQNITAHTPKEMSNNTIQNKPSYPQGRESKKSKMERHSSYNDAWDHFNRDLMNKSFNP